MGYGTCFGIILDSMHTTTFSHVPLSTLSLVAGLSDFVRHRPSLLPSVGSAEGGG